MVLPPNEEYVFAPLLIVSKDCFIIYGILNDPLYIPTVEYSNHYFVPRSHWPYFKCSTATLATVLAADTQYFYHHRKVYY